MRLPTRATTMRPLASAGMTTMMPASPSPRSREGPGGATRATLSLSSPSEAARRIEVSSRPHPPCMFFERFGVRPMCPYVGVQLLQSRSLRECRAVPSCAQFVHAVSGAMPLYLEILIDQCRSMGMIPLLALKCSELSLQRWLTPILLTADSTC